MAQLRIGGGYALLAAFALLLVVGAPALAQEEKAVEGKVVSFEKDKAVVVQVGDDKMEFSVSDETVIEGDVAEGKTVTVTAKDGKASKIVEKKSDQ